MKDFSSRRMDELFLRIRKAGIPKIDLKAVITATNAGWTFYQLYEEILAEDVYKRQALGIYIPLIVVNCIILGRAEAYASKHKPLASLFDGIGMGLGFTLSITCIGAVRELLGAGQLLGMQLLPLADSANGVMGYEPITIFVLAPGAFFVLAALSALQNRFKLGAAKRHIDPSESGGCCSGCESCKNSACTGKEGDKQ